jgi:hypothetical protein
VFKVTNSHEQSPEKQRETFDALMPQAMKLLANLPPDPPEMLIPFWVEKLAQLEADFEAGIPWNFLQNGVIGWTMYAGWQQYNDYELQYIKSKLDKQAVTDLLSESAVGGANPDRHESFTTSGNTVHHANHIVKYCDVTGVSPHDIGAVLEWGGGFGSFARLFRRINQSCTYTMIDVRQFAVLQWLYLSCVLGKDAVNIITNADQTPAGGKVNIVPLSMLSVITWPVDLFVSTWGISESAKPCHDWLVSKKMFEAKHFLLANQGVYVCDAFPFAGEMRRLAGEDAKEIKIENPPENYYLFA